MDGMALPHRHVSERPVQLTFPLEVSARRSLQDFHVGTNAELVARLEELARRAAGDGVPRGPDLGLWVQGVTASGRSHLLQATCHAADLAGCSTLYLPLRALPRDGRFVESACADLIALDDVDAWLGTRELEVALMGLYQSRFDAGRPLLMSAGAPARVLAFALPDLASRCRALPAYTVEPPDDAGLRSVLGTEARRRGLELTDDVLDFWLHRAPRRLDVLLKQLDALDTRSLSEQRRVTIPLVKDVLGL